MGFRQWRSVRLMLHGFRARRAPQEYSCSLPLLKTAQCARFSRVRLKAAASCRTPKASPKKLCGIRGLALLAA